MLLQQAMFSSALNGSKSTDHLINPTSPLASSTASSSPMMDISPLERAFAEERERALAAAASMASRKSPPLPPNSASNNAADHNGNDGNKAAFPFHPASLAAAFNLRPPMPTTTSAGGVLNLSSSQKSSPSESEVESSGGSYKETDRSSPIKEGKSNFLYNFGTIFEYLCLKRNINELGLYTKVYTRFFVAMNID